MGVWIYDKGLLCEINAGSRKGRKDKPHLRDAAAGKAQSSQRLAFICGLCAGSFAFFA